jgi:hypothetical protein
MCFYNVFLPYPHIHFIEKAVANLYVNAVTVSVTGIPQLSDNVFPTRGSTLSTIESL